MWFQGCQRWFLKVGLPQWQPHHWHAAIVTVAFYYAKSRHDQGLSIVTSQSGPRQTRDVQLRLAYLRISNFGAKCVGQSSAGCRLKFWVIIRLRLLTPNEGINQRNLKIWANVTDKICFGHNKKFGSEGDFLTRQP